MNKIVISIAGVVFLLGVLLKILFAFFFPDKFAEGARKVLSLDMREEDLFRTAKQASDRGKKDENQTSQTKRHDEQRK